MPLAPGTRLGPYETVAPLGEGGMGEVYRAKDTRLDRSVAIKILPPALAADPQFRERFDREARAISQLTHPNICTLHDVGEHEGTAFLVMQLLDGETLADRLSKGPVAFADAMRIAVEICSAIDAAHRSGIVHRDLKPGNVMLTKSGAKLLDFGLAKTSGPAIVGHRFSGAAPDLTSTPTVTSPVTQQGTILGTFQYMSPEQIEGAEADARSDIFAFGCVLYELFTGQKAFEGKTRANLIGAILKDEPPAVSRLQPLATPWLDRIVRTCLEKDPDDRWQSARDLLRALEWARTAEPAAAAGPAPVQRRAPTVERVLWASALVAAVAASILGARALRPAAPEIPSTRYVVDTGAALALEQSAIAISPDGRSIVYRAAKGSAAPLGAAFSTTVPQLHLKRSDQFAPAPIAGTDNARGPFFSPDSQWIGFFAEGKLKKVRVAGGPASIVCEAPRVTLGADWGPDDTIVFTMDTASGLLRVPAAGGTPEVFTTPDAAQGERSHRWPAFTPDGRAILFSVRTTQQVQAFEGGGDDAKIMSKSIATGEQHVVLEGGTKPRATPTGHLLFVRNGALMAARLDANTLKSSGSPVPLIEGIASSGATGVSHYDVSANGSLVYALATNSTGERTMVWIDSRGTTREVPGVKKPILGTVLSPDATRAALLLGASGATDLWVFDFTRGTLTRLTFGEGLTSQPVWMPDGRRIAYSSFRNGTFQVFMKSADGGGNEEQLFVGDTLGQFPQSWSPDGRWLLYQRGTGPLSNDLWLLPIENGRASTTEKPKPFIASPFNDSNGSISPDGRWVAYVSNESGRNEVYVQPFSGPSGRWQVSTDGGTQPFWTRKGAELVYRNGDRFMSVAITSGASFAAGTPRQLFQGTFDPSFDVTSDGQRFLMIKGDPLQTPRALNVVDGWFSELRAKVPVQ